MRTIAENITMFRKRANLSLQDLAERITVTQKAVDSWEHDESQPDLDTLILIATALGVDVTDLIYDRFDLQEHKTIKPVRIKTAIILIIPFVLDLAVVFCSFLFESKGQSLIPAWFLHTILLPIAYLLGIAALASIGTIWYNFKINSENLRILLVGLGIISVCFYYLSLYIPSLGYQFSSWLYDHPCLFLLPGILFFLGFNK